VPSLCVRGRPARDRERPSPRDRRQKRHARFPDIALTRPVIVASRTRPNPPVT
jgi:hypothetical protein